MMVKDKVAFEFERKILLAGGLKPTEEVVKLEDIRKLFQLVKRLQKQKEEYKMRKLNELTEKLNAFERSFCRNYEPVSYIKLKRLVEKESCFDKFCVFDIRLSDLMTLIKEKQLLGEK